MEKIFWELVIEGHMSAVKGFIFGLFEGSKRKGTVFFTEENNIKTETFTERLMEWTHLHESLCHLIVEEECCDLIKQGLENTFDRLTLKLKSMRKIKKALFNFKYEVYARKYGEEIKNIFNAIPEPLKISSNYKPFEEIQLECKGLESMAPCHDYSLKAQGSIEGSIDVLLSFYKKIQAYELIKEEPVALVFEK